MKNYSKAKITLINCINDILLMNEIIVRLSKFKELYSIVGMLNEHISNPIEFKQILIDNITKMTSYGILNYPDNWYFDNISNGLFMVCKVHPLEFGYQEKNKIHLNKNENNVDKYFDTDCKDKISYMDINDNFITPFKFIKGKPFDVDGATVMIPLNEYKYLYDKLDFSFPDEISKIHNWEWKHNHIDTNVIIDKSGNVIKLIVKDLIINLC